MLLSSVNSTQSQTRVVFAFRHNIHSQIKGLFFLSALKVSLALGQFKGPENGVTRAATSKVRDQGRGGGWGRGRGRGEGGNGKHSHRC